MQCVYASYDDAIKWKGFPRCWPFVRGIHRSPVNFPNRDRYDLLIAGHLVGEIYPTQNAINAGLWCSFLLAETKFWTNYLAAGNSRRRGAHVTSLYWNALTPVLDNWVKTKNKETKNVYSFDDCFCSEIEFRWVPHDLTDDKSALGLVMVWCRLATSQYHDINSAANATWRRRALYD